MNKVKIILSADAKDFIGKQTLKVREKIYFNIRKIEAGILDKELFKKLEGTEIWEIRTQYESMAYRILAFWDKTHRSLVIATHGFVKKTMKTPKKEVAAAEAIMNDYYNKK